MRRLCVLPVLAGLLLGSCTAVPKDRARGSGERLTVEQVAEWARRGEAAYEVDPRTRAAVDEAYAALTRAARVRLDDYDLLWKAARAAAWLADAERGRPPQVQFARAGIEFANSALAVRAGGAEALYYRAMNTGLLADADHSYGLDAMASMVKDLDSSIAADERFDRAGAHRLIGILYTRAPGPPSGVGSLRKALKHLRRADELFAHDAENLLYLGEAEAEDGNAGAARGHLGAAVDAAPVPGRTAEQETWRREARERLEQVEKR